MLGLRRGFQSRVMLLEFGEQFSKIIPREVPLEGLRRCFPVVLKIEETLGNGIQIGEIVRGENLALHDREVDLHLVEPTGMDWGVNQLQSGKLDAEALHSFGTAVSGAVVDNPEHATSIVVRRSRVLDCRQLLR